MQLKAIGRYVSELRVLEGGAAVEEVPLRLWAKAVCRIGLGTVFLVTGLNHYLSFISMPELPSAAASFLGALQDSGYLMHLIKGLELLGGLLLISNYFAPLALLLLAPGIVNIFLFHLFLAPAGLPLAAVLVGFAAYLGFVSYWDSFEKTLRP